MTTRDHMMPAQQFSFFHHDPAATPQRVSFCKPASPIDELDWQHIERRLDADGFATLGTILDPATCEATARLYAQGSDFRSRIVMERYGFGRGEYQYFAYPLPHLVATLRRAFYTRLAPIANRWHCAMRLPERFPASHETFLDTCRAAGQQRPTPLMLRYGPGDYCCLHQDLYGAHVFPFQVVVLLSQPGRDFTGGELILTESDPKRAGRAEIIPLSQGQAVVFAVNSRPKASKRGSYRASLRHGVSQLHSGQRHTLGLIFHDAK